MQSMHRLIKKENPKGLEVVDVLHALSDDSSLLLFNTIALANGRSNLLISKLDLRRKQFYSRMSRLMKCGLVKRNDGKYFLTSFGKIVYSAQMTIKTALEHNLKLKTIDSLETFDGKILKEERDKIIDLLLEEYPQIKQILVK
jgi:predicted transcriptional regulator